MEIKEHTDSNGERRMTMVYTIPDYITDVTVWPDEDHFVVDFIQDISADRERKVLGRFIMTPDTICDMIDTLEEAFDYWCDLQHNKMAQDRQ